MKKNILLLTGVSLLVLAGCNSGEKTETSVSKTSEKTSVSKENGSNTKESSSSEEKSSSKAESIDIIAKGEYEVGTDIKPGTYYAVLTELTPAEDDTDKSAWVSMDISGEKSDYEILYQVGAKKRVALSDGDTVKFEDNYSPLSWTVRLLDDADFKKYTQENK